MHVKISICDIVILVEIIDHQSLRSFLWLSQISQLFKFQSKTITKKKKTFGQMIHLHLCLKFGGHLYTDISLIKSSYILIIYIYDPHVYTNYIVCRKDQNKALTDCSIIKINYNIGR